MGHVGPKMKENNYMKTKKTKKSSVTGTWIKSNGEQCTVKPTNGVRFTLEELQRYVGGYINIVYGHARRTRVIYVNEEGQLIGLPRNPIATNMWIGEIVGDVLVMSQDDYNIQNTDYNEQQVENPYG